MRGKDGPAMLLPSGAPSQPRVAMKPSPNATLEPYDSHFTESALRLVVVSTTVSWLPMAPASQRPSDEKVVRGDIALLGDNTVSSAISVPCGSRPREARSKS